MTSVFLYSVYRRKIVKQGKCLKRIVFNLFSMSRLNSTVGRRELKLNHVNTDTEGNIESVPIKWVEFRKKCEGFLTPGTKQLLVVMSCIKWVSVTRGSAI